MSLFRETTSRGSKPLEAALSRLLLASQYDFRQKTWSPPRLNTPRDIEAELRFFVREYPKLCRVIEDFQTKGGSPAGGESSSLSAARSPASDNLKFISP
jgi:hypothetical protein